MVRNANSCLVTSKCCECPSFVRNIPSEMLLDPKLFLDPKICSDYRPSHHGCLDGINSGQCHFRQKRSEKNYTSFSPCRLGVLSGFVFTSDHVCPEDSVIMGSMVMGTDLVLIPMYLGVCPKVWYGPQTPRSESSNYSIKGQDQNKGIMHWRSRSE